MLVTEAARCSVNNLTFNGLLSSSALGHLNKNKKQSSALSPRKEQVHLSLTA